MSDMIDLMMKFSTSADVWGEVKLVHVLPQNLFFIFLIRSIHVHSL